MASVLVVQCGGTIDKDYPSRLHGYSFEIDECATIRILEKTCPPGYFTATTVCKKDSTDMTDEDRENLVKACSSASQDKIIITHGTSTMVQTGRALVASGQLENKTIVITGALLPEVFKDSDASFNAGCAVGALNVAPPGVYIAMSGRVFPYDQVARDKDGYFVHLSTQGAVAGDDPGIQLP
eukprot:m.22554 g.22554  ORF g.22554 m.22554 type:complete len:182 (+) comp7411_c0_seq1:192-737(+)